MTDETRKPRAKAAKKMTVVQKRISETNVGGEITVNVFWVDVESCADTAHAEKWLLGFGEVGATYRVSTVQRECTLHFKTIEKRTLG